MKKFKRVLGVDDGPFNRESEQKAPIVGVMARFDGYIEGIAIRSVEIDGTDATEQIVSMFQTHFGSQIDYVMLNGITVAGFNICDIERIKETTGVPVMSVARKNPDVASMLGAIRKYFSDYVVREKILLKSSIEPISLKNGKMIYVNLAGIKKNEALLVIERTVIRGNIPEPIRVAHMIAGAIKNGESKGKV